MPRPAPAWVILAVAIIAAPLARAQATLGGGQTAPSGRRGSPPPKTDPAADLLKAFQAVLLSGQPEGLQPLFSPSLPDADAKLAQAWARVKPDRVALHERDRRDALGQTVLSVEALFERAGEGRLANWEITAAPRGAGGGDVITGLRQINLVTGLYRLTLDRSQEYRLRDFHLREPDLDVAFSSGTAFAALTPDGVTALAIEGKGRVRFTPGSETEQGQLDIFAGARQLDTPIVAAFLRLDPGDYTSMVADGGLAPTSVEANDTARAQAIFDLLAPQSFNVSLGELSEDLWTTEPGAGDAVVELQTSKYGWLTYARDRDAPEDVTFFDRRNHHNICAYATPEKLATRGPTYSDNDGQPYDVQHVDLDVRFDPARQGIAGRAAIRLTMRQGGVSTLTLKLADELVVSSVTSPGFGPLLSLRSPGQNSILVGLPAASEPGETLTLVISYAGRLDPGPIDREALWVPAPQDVAADQGFETVPTLVYSTREFWYPRPVVSDYATATMKLTVPDGYDVIGSGSPTPASAAEAGGGANAATPPGPTITLEAARPVRYLSAVISQLELVGADNVRVPRVAPVPNRAFPLPPRPFVRITTVSTPREQLRARALATHAAETMAYYASLVGEAPYPDLTLAAIESDRPGGHSPAELALINAPVSTEPQAWQNDPVVFERYPFFVLAHELAHQWWGQAVGWKNYHEQWLSEGLAQYFAVRAVAHDRGAEAAHDLLESMRRSAERYEEAGPISLGYRLGHIKNDPDAFRAIVYNKSAVVLDMLRRFIGDRAFTRGLARYYDAWRFKKAGTEDLQAAFEAEAGRPLGRFFDQWVRGAALPTVHARCDVSRDGATATLHVQQEGAAFDLPVTVRIRYRDGSTETVSYPVTAGQFETTFPLAGPVRDVTVDTDTTLGRFK